MQSQKRSFDTLDEVISFISECLDNRNPSNLYDATLEETDGFWKAHIFQDLLDIQQSETLSAVFLEGSQISAFPPDATAASLGGCNPRPRHLHIDLKKHAGHWYIKKIWKCR